MSDASRPSPGPPSASDAMWPPLAPLLVALGQLALLVVVPADVSVTLPASPGLLTLLAGEVLLATLLGISIRRTEPRAKGVLAYVLATAAVGGLLLVGLRATEALWLVALALLGTVVVAAYLLHRVELLRLGLIGGADTS